MLSFFGPFPKAPISVKVRVLTVSLKNRFACPLVDAGGGEGGMELLNNNNDGGGIDPNASDSGGLGQGIALGGGLEDGGQTDEGGVRGDAAGGIGLEVGCRVSWLAF